MLIELFYLIYWGPISFKNKIKSFTFRIYWYFQVCKHSKGEWDTSKAIFYFFVLTLNINFMLVILAQYISSIIMFHSCSSLKFCPWITKLEYFNKFSLRRYPIASGRDFQNFDCTYFSSATLTKTSKKLSLERYRADWVNLSLSSKFAAIKSLSIADIGKVLLSKFDYYGAFTW